MAEENQDVEQNQGQEPKEPEGKTYTQSELDSMLDKHTSKALETAKQKWDEEKQAEISKAEQLAKMSAAERKAEEDKAKQEAMNKREKELNMREYRYEARHQLEDNGLSVDFVDMVMADDAETTKNNIAALKSQFDKAVEASVNEKMKGNTPKTGTPAGRLTKQEILSVSDQAERQRLIGENLDLFKN